MVRHVDAISSQGSFRPLAPIALPEGARVRLSVEEDASGESTPRPAKIHTPKLADPKDTPCFVMQIRQTGTAGV